MPRLTLASPWLLFASATLLVLLTTITLRRRPTLPRLSTFLAAAAALALTLSTAGLTWRRPAATDLVVMVDLSPSTRGAAFRDRAALSVRIRQLIPPGARYDLLYFAAANTPAAPGDPARPLPDLPADRTVFAPPAAPTILLFSDGRFDPPAPAPPTFVVADPHLDRPTDAAVLALRAHTTAATTSLAATVRLLAPPATDTPRQLTITPAASDPTSALDPAPNPLTLSRPIRPGASIASATFAPDPSDRWPENDALTLPLLPPAHTERWFVTTGPSAPAGWTLKRPADLTPANSPDYLTASLIALDNLPAAAIPPDRQRALEQYVRDLGGGLLILGGDRAFAAGLYPGTPLETLSPLASVPPNPTTHWLLLADSSGSMSQPAAANSPDTRWQRATRALLSIVPSLPPDDFVSLASFADDLTYWLSPARRPARDLIPLLPSLPPRTVTPSGPTNLAAALDRIARETDPATPTELLVLSDADVQIDDPAGLAARLKAKRIRLHLLALSDPGVTQPQGLPALRTITQSTGGTLLTESTRPDQWAAQVRQLLTAALPNRLSTSPTPATFTHDLAPLPPRPVSPWNRTWLTPRATLLATTPSPDTPNTTIPLAARHPLGAGEVLATAFAPNPIELSRIATLLARPPRDPRFTITWTPASKLTVRIDVTPTASQDPNRLPLTLTLTPSTQDSALSTQHFPIPQTAPARYELTIDAPRTPTFAAVRLNNQTLDQTPLPARYPPEFDAVGNDYPAMERLAAATGGQLVTAAHTQPLTLPTAHRDVPLATPLTLTAAALLAGALARWRWT